MYPILFHIGPITIHTYGLMLALGVMAGLLLLRRLARDAGLDADKLQNLALWVVLAGIAGARIAFLALEPNGFANPWQVFMIWQGGLVFYGGLAAALPVAWWRGRRLGLSFPALADLLAPSLALGQAFGRLGCFFSGDSFGKPWDGPWPPRESRCTPPSFTSPGRCSSSPLPCGGSFHGGALPARSPWPTACCTAWPGCSSSPCGAIGGATLSGPGSPPPRFSPWAWRRFAC